MTPLVIVGGGEHARVVAEAAAAAGWVLEGYTDRSAGEPGVLGLPWLGTDADLAERASADHGGGRPVVILGFGAVGEARRRAVEALDGFADWATVIHPAASVSPSAAVAGGAVVLARAVIGAGARVGAHAIVNSGAVVEHDVEVGDGAHVAPGAIVGGGAHVGRDAFIGLGALVRDHVAVGDGAVVAMGAVVTADVPSGATVMGMPARPVGEPAAGDGDDG